MGMFDEIKCEYPLPDPEVQDKTFQTKSFHNTMDRYVITKEGRLLLDRCRYEFIPEEERPYYGKPEWDDPDKGELFRWFGSMKRVHESWHDEEWHGIITFYTVHGREKELEGTWYEYEAKFTDGNLVKIKRINAEGR